MYITDNVMVCVTQQKTCERLIKKGENIKSKYGGELYVIHVAKEGVNFLGNKKEAEALEYLFDISKSVGADLTVLRSNSIVGSLCDFAASKNIGYVVLGEPPEDIKDDGIITELKEKLPFCQFYILSPQK